MSQPQPKSPIDLDEIRRSMSEQQASGASQRARTELNAFARQIAEQFREHSHSPSMLIGEIRIFEGLCLLAVGCASHFFAGTAGTLFSNHILGSLVFAPVMTVLFLQIVDAYQVQAMRGALKMLPRVLGSWLGVMGLVTIGYYFSRSGGWFDRGFLLTWLGSGIVFLTIERLIIAYAVKHWARDGTMERRAVIVGGGEAAKQLIRSLEQQPENDIRICGIFDDRDDSRSPVIVAGYPKLGTIDELVEFARLARLDMLIISLPITAEARILHLLKKLWVLPLDIRLAAHANKLHFRPRAYSHVGSVPMLDIFDKPIRDWDSVAKRVFDIVFCLGALFLLWPVMVATAIAIKLDSKGPVLFVQKRHGFNNEVINVLKFRSMYTEMSDPTAKMAVTKGDPRVTKVGRFIRKTSIDELPQLFNVLRGDLSLVGPRPHAVEAQTRDRRFNDVVEGYFARHRVKPGVTGWAQINGWRGEVDSDDKIKFRTAYDLFYIENWSLFFDLKILLLTPIRLLNTENAY
ncbi:undecaprenyl-phosphate glucose phosphotransferase [Gellertiella hungarica]|uniref:Undecaprenyl-phosphate glucose phosphotransferase n=1 Tax=Gellertiella hungarica TaxID=1572859 RepID=A0A7W6JAY6_9HYPH|nr:undecaprenyl-phosphate glucose phosphotransferase [Gellertiella hungarica]MBB4067113.1 Undecaprenyl-phosphate glucose phosphotransferase [Gellertiella hungarica]